MLLFSSSFCPVRQGLDITCPLPYYGSLREVMCGDPFPWGTCRSPWLSQSWRPWLTLAQAVHVPCQGEGHSTPYRPAERATVFHGLGEEAIVGLCLQEERGRGECLTNLPLSGMEEDIAMVGVPRYSTLWSTLSRAVHLLPPS